MLRRVLFVLFAVCAADSEPALQLSAVSPQPCTSQLSALQPGLAEVSPQPWTSQAPAQPGLAEVALDDAAKLRRRLESQRTLEKQREMVRAYFEELARARADGK